MIVVSPDLDAAVAGTSYNDQITATAWRDGLVVAANLAVLSWSFGWDATSDQIGQGRCTLVVGDPDGTLSPWSMDDPLGAGGSYVQLAWLSGMTGIRVPRGNWLIRQAEPAETWRYYKGGLLRVSGGATITLTLEEYLPAQAAKAAIDGDAPVAGATAIAELRRLTVDIGAVDATLAPADVTIPPQYAAWPQQRTDAMGDLLNMLGARSRIGGDSSFQVVPMAGVGPVWTVQGGETGVLIGSHRILNDNGVYNSMTSTNSSTNGAEPLVARAYVQDGPLRYGGPYGKVPGFHQATGTTQTEVAADAVAMLAAITNSGTVDLAVECLAHPALQLQDTVTLLTASVAGDQAVVGRIVAMDWASDSDKQMNLKVRVSTAALEAIAERVRRG